MLRCHKTNSFQSRVHIQRHTAHLPSAMQQITMATRASQYTTSPVCGLNRLRMWSMLSNFISRLPLPMQNHLQNPVLSANLALLLAISP